MSCDITDYVREKNKKLSAERVVTVKKHGCFLETGLLNLGHHVGHVFRVPCDVFILFRTAYSYNTNSFKGCMHEMMYYI